MGWASKGGYPETYIDANTGDITIVHSNGSIIHETNKNNKK